MIFSKYVTLALAFSLPISKAFLPREHRIVRSSLAATTIPEAPPERTAPSAGYLPEWENRSGLPPAEFLASDMSKPDRSDMWECPLTLWDFDGYDQE
jgi:hypothetical protein